MRVNASPHAEYPDSGIALADSALVSLREMKRLAMCVVALALTACGNNGQQPPVEDVTHDASDEKPVEASTPDVQMPEASPPVDAGSDAGDAGLDANDAMPEAATPEAATDASDAMAEAAAPIAMCCTLAGATNLCPEADAGSAVVCASNYCTVNNVIGTLAACPVCSGVVTDSTCGSDASDAAAPLTCGATSVSNSGGLVCVCPQASTCHYGDTIHCTAECL